MKIERISDNQIRCTISKADLTERKIKLSELACGTGNSKELFRDMIRQASDDFGFEVDDIPLMVEAIPVSPECIILILTKVDNPEETESHFAKLLGDEELNLMDRLTQIEDLDEFEDIESIGEFDSLDSGIQRKLPPKSPTASSGDSESNLYFDIYEFDNLPKLIELSKLVSSVYEGDSALYKSPHNNKYYISLCTDSPNLKSLVLTANILSEYGKHQYSVYNSEFFYMEHFDTLIDTDAITKLASL